MMSLSLAELKGSIDFGIITIRQDEYDAVLDRFEGEDSPEGERNYRISDVIANEAGEVIRVAIVRCTEPGLGEAQSVANDLINDLAPECLLAVGIAGGIRDDDFSLGDVVVATYIHDFSMEAVLKSGKEFNLRGAPLQKSVQNLAVSLKSYDKKLGDWAHDAYIPKEIPPVEYQNPKLYYGPKAWKEKVYKSLEKHFGENAKRRSPKVVDGAVASSDRLIKNVEYTQNLLSFVRSTRAVEMEVAGVYRATRKAKRKDYLVTTIRGISDIIGFDRDDGWTKYACQSAAAFTYAFVKSGILISPKKIHEKGGSLILPSNFPISVQSKLAMIRQIITASVDLLGKTKDLLDGYVTVGNCDDAIENIRQIQAEFSNISEILKTGNSLLPFSNAFLVEFGLEQDGGLKALIRDIQHFRSILRTTDADATLSEIQDKVNEIARNINKLIAQYLN